MAKKIEVLDIGVLFTTGSSGNGKSTWIELLEEIYRPKHKPGAVARIDVSRIITRWGMHQHGEIGDELRKHQYLIEEGKYVPDYAVIPAFQKWTQEMLRDIPNLELLLVAGAPRTPDQVELLEQFARSQVVNIKATREQSDASVYKRWLDSMRKKGAKVRADDAGGQEVKDTRWQEHLTFTPPTMALLNGNGLHLDRSDPLTERLRMLLMHQKEQHMTNPESCPVPIQMVMKGLARLDSPGHPIHQKIREIESPTPVEDVFADLHPHAQSMIRTSDQVFAQ